MNLVRNYPAHRLDGSYEVKIVSVVTPCLLYVSLIDEAKANQEILEVMRGYDPSHLDRLVEEEIFSGSPVFVAIANEFYRGAIVDQTTSTDSIRVWLGDYAIEVTVGLDDLYAMPETFRDESWQTLGCGLAGIQPVQGETWSTDTCEALRDSIVGCHLVMRTVYPDETFEAVWVDLDYSDPRTEAQGGEGGFVSMIDELLNTGHARKAYRQSGFDWGDGIGTISDRRRSAEMERKWALQRRGFHSAGRVLPMSAQSDNVMSQLDSRRTMIHEDLDIPSTPDGSFLYDDWLEHYTAQSSTTYICTLDSCGESDDGSDLK